MNHIILIHREPVINTLRQSHQISSLDMDAHPLVLLVAYVKESRSPENVTNFFSVVNVFFEEGFDFVFVRGEFVGVDCDDVGIGISTVV